MSEDQPILGRHHAGAPVYTSMLPLPDENHDEALMRAVSAALLKFAGEIAYLTANRYQIAIAYEDSSAGIMAGAVVGDSGHPYLTVKLN